MTKNTHPNKGKANGYFSLFVTSTVWGTTWVASKFALQHKIPAIQLAYIRQFLAGLCFVAFFLFIKKLPLPNKKQWRWIVVMAFLMFVCANWLSTWGIKYISTGLASLIGALYPLSVVLMERFFFKGNKISSLTLIGLFLGIAGVGFVFYENISITKDYTMLIGLGLSLIAMLSWSLGTIFIARNKTSINPYFGIGWQMLISSFLLFCFSTVSNQNIPLSDITAEVWLSIIYLVVFGSIVSFIAFIHSMKTLPPAISSLYAYANPIVAMLLAAVVLDDQLTISMFWGTLVTLAGVYLVNYSVKKNQKKVIAESEL